jgi:hypothetical protein
VRMIEEFGQRLLGVNDNLMGQVNPGGRKTAQEVRISSSFSTNRLKTQAEWFSATGFNQLSRMMISNSQQYMTAPQKLRVAGDLPAIQLVEANKETIAGFYDFNMVDGTMPIDRMASAAIMRDLFKEMIQTQLASAYKVPDLFEYIAQLSGARAVKRFRIQVQDPGVLQQQAQAGNVVPMPIGRMAGQMPSGGQFGQQPVMNQAGTLGG